MDGSRKDLARSLRCFVAMWLLVALGGCGGGDSMNTAPPAVVRGGTVAAPQVEGPVAGGAGAPFLATTTFDLAEVGYAQAEYFLTGTATAYANRGALGIDGRWSVDPANQASYRTRIVVYRPIDPRRFNGTVLVEWLNVSGGLDAAADWLMAHTELTRSGYAYVGVSAQYVGVEGGDSLLGVMVSPLKEVDPARYASLQHPGDSYSYDIFSQAAQAVRRPRGVTPLGELQPQRLLAAGESQSAFRMVTYINAVHPVADIYDGFLVHSRGNIGGDLSQPPLPSIPVPGVAQIRTDLNVPVLNFQTETDLTFLGSVLTRQPDSDRFRLWEVAGTAHADTYTVVAGNADRGDSPEAVRMVISTNPLPEFECAQPINSGPQHYVLKAAITALDRWVRTGTPAPTAPRLQAASGPRLLRDPHGNALGGVRTPHVDVPIARLTGDGQTGSLFCALFGSTVPFDSAKLATLYPNRAAYLDAFHAAADAAVAAGFVLAPDAALMKEAAALDFVDP